MPRHWGWRAWQGRCQDTFRFGVLKCNSNVNEHERSRIRSGNGHIKKATIWPALLPMILFSAPFMVGFGCVCVCVCDAPLFFLPRPTGCGCKTYTHTHTHTLRVAEGLRCRTLAGASKKLAKPRKCADESKTNLSHARLWQPRVLTSHAAPPTHPTSQSLTPTHPLPRRGTLYPLWPQLHPIGVRFLCCLPKKPIALSLFVVVIVAVSSLEKN